MGNVKKRQQRAKAVQKKQARIRHEQRGIQPESPSPNLQLDKTVQQPPDRIVVSYNSPDALRACGPIVRAAWSVPVQLAQYLTQGGQPVPRPVYGFMLIDTGASHTCMALEVAKELGLSPIRLMETYGAGGLHRNPVFEAALRISIADGRGNQTSLDLNSQVMGIPDFGRHLPNDALQVPDNFPTRMIGLLGRDFLRIATLTYDGSRGVVDIRLDLSQL